MPILARAGAAAAKGFGMLGKIAAAVDEYFEYVTLLLHGNGTNGAQNNTFLDSSTNNFTITRNGNTTQGTFTPYGSNWSNYFDGSGDYLSIPSSAGLRFDGQFCVEGWVNFNAFNTQNFLISQFTAAGEAGWLVRYTGTALRLYAQNGAVTIDRTWSPSRGVWYHFAVTRDSSNDIRFFIDGTQLGATATGVSTTMSSTNTAYIGGHPDIANDTNAYLSNMRVVKGSAVYTANFIPSTAPLTAITNTSLLTCQSNRFIDNSSNNFTITRNGDVSVQRFSPFNPTTPYAAGTIGGSGYFDGTGDNLTATLTSQAPGTGDFTYQFWVYQPTAAAVCLFDTRAVNNNTTGFALLINGSNQLAVYTNGTVLTGSGAITAGSWSFVTVTRSGSTLTIYLNGVSQGTTTFTNNLTDTALRLGQYVDSTGTLTGYISGFKYVKGSADSATNPVTPQTATSGTQFLASFTNGGIIDNAMMNDLETVGNAQISTSVSKFGGGSLAFDGAGDWLTMPNSKGLYIGSGDFTIEGWLYLNALGSVRAIVSQFSSGGTGPGWTLYTKTNNVLEFYGGSGTVTVTGTTAIAATTWTHFAVVRSGSTITIYVNGVAGGSATNSSFSDDTTALGYVGGRADSAGLALNGYIDDLRITKGYARYTANFTPPAAPFPDQ